MDRGQSMNPDRTIFRTKARIRTPMKRENLRYTLRQRRHGRYRQIHNRRCHLDQPPSPVPTRRLYQRGEALSQTDRQPWLRHESSSISGEHVHVFWSPFRPFGDPAVCTLVSGVQPQPSGSGRDDGRAAFTSTIPPSIDGLSGSHRCCSNGSTFASDLSPVNGMSMRPM